MGTTLTITSTLRITYRTGMRAGMVNLNDKVAPVFAVVTHGQFGYSFKFYVERNVGRGTLDGINVTKVLAKSKISGK